MKKVHILFVCLGNICRSPAAEGIMRHLVDKTHLANEISIMSCGLGAWHVGHPPDHRIRQAASARGIALTSKAKTFLPNFLDEFDYILGADNEIIEQLHRVAQTPEHKAKIHLMTAFGKVYRNQEVGDPYYAGPSAFEDTLDILEDACLGLLEEIGKRE